MLVSRKLTRPKLIKLTPKRQTNLQKNMGVLVFIVVIWGTAVVLYFTDKMIWRLKLMNENISDRGYWTFRSVKTAFKPEEATPNDIALSDKYASFAHQLRMVRAPAPGKVYSEDADEHGLARRIAHQMPTPPLAPPSPRRSRICDGTLGLLFLYYT